MCMLVLCVLRLVGILLRGRTWTLDPYLHIFGLHLGLQAKEKSEKNQV